MRCGSCGSPVPEAAAFCPECGRDVYATGSDAGDATGGEGGGGTATGVGDDAAGGAGDDAAGGAGDDAAGGAGDDAAGGAGDTDATVGGADATIDDADATVGDADAPAGDGAAGAGREAGTGSRPGDGVWSPADDGGTRGDSTGGRGVDWGIEESGVDDGPGPSDGLGADDGPAGGRSRAASEDTWTDSDDTWAGSDDTRSDADDESPAFPEPTRLSRPADSRHPAPVMGTGGEVVGHRVGAFLVDRFVLTVLVVAPFAAGVAVEPAVGSEAASVVLISGSVAALVAVLVYTLLVEGIYGQTPGKKLFGIVVVKEDGAPCTVGASVLRSLLWIVDRYFLGLVGFALVLATDRNQRFGDIVAHTVVVRTA